MTLEDQFLICLEIMATGDDMPAIGNWVKVLEAMEIRGFARRVGADFRITAEGRVWYEENCLEPEWMKLGFGKGKEMEDAAPDA